MHNTARVYDVAIIGAGPTGIILANLLGSYGLSVIILERYKGILDIPRAVHIDGETMRVFQSAGLAQHVLPILRPGHSMHWVNAKGQTLLVRNGHAGLSDQGWHNDYYFHQPHLEACLRQGLARFSSIEFREEVEVQDYAEHDGIIALRLVATEGRGAPETVRARYIVGCDGARSTVRSWLGDQQEDLGLHQAWLVVDVILNHPLPLPEHTVQHCDPARPATSIYVHPLRRRWEIQAMPGDDLSALTEPSTVWKLLSPWVKPTQGRIERAATYEFHSLIATRWQQGRIFLAGDAAHQTPPFLGQGLCAGVRDAANLAWKLALGVRSENETALATYGSERIPHVREFIQLAVDVGKVIQVTDPAEASERDRKLIAEGLQFSFPRPRLGQPGVFQGKAPAGQIFIQPLLDDGRWMDDVVGTQFGLLLHPTLAAKLPLEFVRHARAAGIATLPAPGAQGVEWLDDHQAVAVLIRPDRYIFEVVAHATELAPAVGRVRQYTQPASDLSG